jgi:hypothetical protein
MNFYKESIKSNIAGLNPTGTLDFNGTFNLNGPNNTIQNSTIASKSILNNINNNKVVCSNIENFENLFLYENNKNKDNKKNILLLLFFIFFASFIFYFLRNN